MGEQSQPSHALTPATTAALIQRAMRARQNGNLPAARALLDALVTQQPSPQAWLALAGVAASRAEQRRAIEQALALDPQHPLALRALAHLQAAQSAVVGAPADCRLPTADHRELLRTDTPPASSTPPGIAPAPAITPTAPTPEQRARALRWPIYLVLGAAALVVALAAWWLRPNTPIAAPTPTPALPGVVLIPTQAPTLAASTAPASPAPTPPAPTSAPAPGATSQPTLAAGQIVRSGQWHAVLLRPEHALSLEGPIGQFQPQGRFFLVLLTIGNRGPAPAPVPASLAQLADARGRSFTPQPALSSAYLAAYGRGQHGDLSMDDMIPADGSNKSVPLIFDIPLDARDLTLLIAGTAEGWPVGAQAR